MKILRFGYMEDTTLPLPLASPDGGDTPVLWKWKPFYIKDMINYDFIARELREWSDEYQRYLDAVRKYFSTPRFIRWLKDMDEPRYPSFHCMRLVNNIDDCFVVELRYWCGDLSLAVRLGNIGCRIDVETYVRSGLLGGRIGELDSFHDMMVMEIMDNLHDTIHNVDQSKKEPEYC